MVCKSKRHVDHRSGTVRYAKQRCIKAPPPPKYGGGGALRHCLKITYGTQMAAIRFNAGLFSSELPNAVNGRLHQPGSANGWPWSDGMARYKVNQGEFACLSLSRSHNWASKGTFTFPASRLDEYSLALPYSTFSKAIPATA